MAPLPDPDALAVAAFDAAGATAVPDPQATALRRIATGHGAKGLSAKPCRILPMTLPQGAAYLNKHAQVSSFRLADRWWRTAP